MSKFDEYFKDVQFFTGGIYVVTGELTREEAAKAFNDSDEDLEVTADDVTPDRVRFGFPPETVEDREDLGACWYTGAYGKGSKAVWVVG